MTDTNEHLDRIGISSIFDDNFVANVNSVSSLNDIKASNIMLGAGITSIMLLVIFKSSLLGAPLGDLVGWEFVSVVWASSLLIVFGSWMRLYQYRIIREMKNNLVTAQVDIARFHNDKRNNDSSRVYYDTSS